MTEDDYSPSSRRAGWWYCPVGPAIPVHNSIPKSLWQCWQRCELFCSRWPVMVSMCPAEVLTAGCLAPANALFFCHHR